MKDEKIIEVCNIYKDKLDHYFGEAYIPDTYKHLMWMLWQIPHFIKEGRKEKVNRWLGFVQGALWANEIYTIEEMKEHNKPDGK